MELSIPNKIKSFIRVLHASPKSPSVDIYINNMPTIIDLRYKGFTEYLPIPAGTYNIKLYESGTTNLVFQDDVKIDPNQIMTVAAIGVNPKSLSLFPVIDPKLTVDTTKAYLRLIHLSPNTPSIDVVTSNNKTLFENVGYKDKQGYIGLEANIYDIDLNLTGTTTSVLYVPNMKLRPNKFYTIYVVGLLNENPPLQVLIPLDGNSYINFYS